jgi:hypothetical protein
MKEIVELNERISKELGKCFSEGELTLGREDQPEELTNLPNSIQTEVKNLRQKLNQVVPNDFSYTIYIGDESQHCFTLEYKDGPQTGFSAGHAWNPKHSIFQQLNSLDWDTERAQAMEASQMLERMKADAEKRPANLPSTRQLQKAFRGEMKEFVKEERKDSSIIHVMIWRDDEGITCATFPDLKSFSRELFDMMPCGYLVITIVADGKPLSVEKIELLKKKTLMELEEMPISHLKALGKWQ